MTAVEAARCEAGHLFCVQARYGTDGYSCYGVVVGDESLRYPEQLAAWAADASASLEWLYERAVVELAEHDVDPTTVEWSGFGG